MSRYWPILPAAGVGSRMKAHCPKQYLSLQGQYLIDHTLSRFLHHPSFEKIVLVLSDNDGYWADSQYYQSERIIRAAGGRERSDSVLAGLRAIECLADDDDWVLVHDIARPCLQHSDIDHLINQTLAYSTGSDSIEGSRRSGGLLAVPVRDTMKRSNPQQQGISSEQLAVVDHTVERAHLWHALTPQMFRYRDLLDGLVHCQQQTLPVTDEASAMEYLGYQPLLVSGRADNIKVTHPQDLALAELFLSQEQ